LKIKTCNKKEANNKAFSLVIQISNVKILNLLQIIAINNFHYLTSKFK